MKKISGESWGFAPDVKSKPNVINGSGKLFLKRYMATFGKIEQIK